GKADRDFLLRRFFGAEELGRSQAHPSGQDIRGKALDRGVEREDVDVVELARVGDLLFSVAQIGLQLLEDDHSLELRIRLRYRHQAAERLGQYLIRGRSRAGPRGLRQRAARTGDLAEHVVFVSRIAAHRFDQIRDQAGPAFQLHADAGPRFLRAIAAADEAVIEEDSPHTDYGGDGGNED